MSFNFVCKIWENIQFILIIRKTNIIMHIELYQCFFFSCFLVEILPVKPNQLKKKKKDCQFGRFVPVPFVSFSPS